MWGVSLGCRAHAHIWNVHESVAEPGPQHAPRQDVEDVPALADEALVVFQPLTALHQAQDLL